jgi:hypothetical protein
MCCSSFTKSRISAATNCIEFPLADRWMNGEEYAFMIRHYQAYTQMNPDMVSVSDFGHPEEVYE